MKIKKLLFLVLFLLSSPNVLADEMGRVVMSSEYLNGNLLRVNVEADAMVAPVLGLAFHLVYDEDALAFLRYDPGEFLERGGDPFYLVRDDVGRLYFGETLRKDDSFPVGGGSVVSFYFQRLEEADYVFEFENAVVSTLDETRQDIDEIFWGNLEVGPESLGQGLTSVLNSPGLSGHVWPKWLMGGGFVALLLTLYWFLRQKKLKKRAVGSVNLE